MAPGLVYPGQISPDVGQSPLQGNSLLVDSGVVLRLQQAGHGPAAQKPPVEAGPFFVSEDDYLQRVAQST